MKYSYLRYFLLMFNFFLFETSEIVHIYVFLIFPFDWILEAMGLIQLDSHFYDRVMTSWLLGIYWFIILIQLNYFAFTYVHNHWQYPTYGPRTSALHQLEWDQWVFSSKSKIINFSSFIFLLQTALPVLSTSSCLLLFSECWESVL